MNLMIILYLIAAFTLGFIVASTIWFFYGRKIMKIAVANAETRGIHSGAILEAEVGWTKKPSK